jgi:hypothetical protein
MYLIIFLILLCDPALAVLAHLELLLELCLHNEFLIIYIAVSWLILLLVCRHAYIVDGLVFGFFHLGIHDVVRFLDDLAFRLDHLLLGRLLLLLSCIPDLFWVGHHPQYALQVVRSLSACCLPVILCDHRDEWVVLNLHLLASVVVLCDIRILRS